MPGVSPGSIRAMQAAYLGGGGGGGGIWGEVEEVAGPLG